MSDLVVRVRRLDGLWEQLATGQDYGVLPESLNLSSNKAGPDRASFVLQRHPDMPRLDLAHDTPIEVEVGSLLVWDGRIVEAPAGENVSVACEGWQYALDDFTYTCPYVHHDLGDWKDFRTFLTAPLGTGALAAYFQVTQEDGALVIMIPKGTVCVAGEFGGFVLDAGPDAFWQRIGIEYETNNANLGVDPRLYIRGHTRPDNVGWTSDDIVQGLAWTTLGAKGVRAGMLPSGQSNPFIAKRYLQLFMYVNASGTTTGDQWIKIKAARSSMFTSTGLNAGPPYYIITQPGATDPEPQGGYVMGTKSRLRSDHLIVDAMSRVSLLTSPGTFESASFRDEVLGSEGLYAYYRFQESNGSNTAKDSSGNGHTADIWGTLTYQQPRLLAADPADPDPASGNSIQFTANTNAQHIDVPTLDISETGLTVEVVFKTPLGGTDELTIFSIGDSFAAGHDLALYISVADSKLYWGDQQTAGRWIASTNALVAGRTYYAIAAWHPSYPPVLVIYDATSGVLGSGVAANAFAWSGGTTPTVQIGNFTLRNATSGLIGTIDELAIYQQYMTHPESPLAPFGGWRTVEPRRRALAAINREIGEIKRGGFVLPSYNHQSRSPREAIDAAEAFHGYQTRVRPGRTWGRRALPTAPIAKIGDWPGSSFEDASNNSGRDVVNSARVTGTDPAGNPVVAVYSTADLPDALLATGPAPQPANPSFDVDTSYWSADGSGGGTGIVGRDTSVFDTSPASLSILNNTAGSYQQGVYTQTFIGQFQPGRAYFLSIALKGGAGMGGTQISQVRILDRDTGQIILVENGPNLVNGGAWQRYISSRFLTRSPHIAVIINAGNGNLGGNGFPIFYVDSVKVLASAYTVLDRQGGFREKVMTVSEPITQVSALQLAKLLLLNNMLTPFKGNAELTDDGARGNDDRQVATVESLLWPGELIHVADRADPDKGGVGRDGRIVGVSWDYKTRKAQLALDNQRGELLALLTRYGAKVS